MVHGLPQSTCRAHGSLISVLFHRRTHQYVQYVIAALTLSLPIDPNCGYADSGKLPPGFASLKASSSDSISSACVALGGIYSFRGNSGGDGVTTAGALLRGRSDLYVIHIRVSG